MMYFTISWLKRGALSLVSTDNGANSGPKNEPENQLNNPIGPIGDGAAEASPRPGGKTINEMDFPTSFEAQQYCLVVLRKGTSRTRVEPGDAYNSSEQAINYLNYVVSCIVFLLFHLRKKRPETNILISRTKPGAVRNHLRQLIGKLICFCEKMISTSHNHHHHQQLFHLSRSSATCSRLCLMTWASFR